MVFPFIARLIPVIAPRIISLAPKIIPAISKITSSVVKFIPKLIPQTFKGKVIASVGVPVAIGAFTSRPVETTKAIIDTPIALANVGGNLAELATDPSIEKAKTLVTENPLIVGVAAVIAGLVASKVLVPAISSARQTEAIQEQTEIIKEAGGKIPSKEVVATNERPLEPIPATQKIVTTRATGTRKRTRKVKVSPQNITQRVNINFDNDEVDNKRYINRHKHLMINGTS